ncbi:MATE family efflux transporter [Bengtsoniella intestinalis]|uniref:MATE family efflux transporter n=1 Tax=Bengtsoniella intestinalis TaxID=3073143 RepID=UPI00391F623A
MLPAPLRRPKAFYQHLFALTLPIMLQNLITTSLGFIDTFMVGLVGTNELSAVTAANSPIFFVQMVIFGLMSGLSVLASQYWGKEDVPAINRTLGVALYVSFTVALIVAGTFFFASETVMSLVTNNQNLIAIGAPYLQIVAVGLVFNTLSSVYISMQRSTENPAFGMQVFAVSMLLNTFLNYCLIFGHFGAPAMGVMGAAYATLTSRIVEFVIVVVYVLTNHRVPLEPKLVFSPRKSAVVQFFKHGLPVLANETVWGLGTSMMVVIIGHMTSSADMLAAYAIIGNVDKIAITICIGMANGSAVMIGKAIGEGQPHQTVQDLGKSLFAISVVGGCAVAAMLLTLLPLVFQPFLFPLFNLSAEATAIATTMCITFACVFPVRSYDFTSITGVLRAGGDIGMAFFIDVIPLWCFSIPLAALCALVWDSPVWLVCLWIHGECLIKMPLGLWRFQTKKWIHNLTTEVAP